MKFFERQRNKKDSSDKIEVYAGKQDTQVYSLKNKATLEVVFAI